jgi:cyclase
LDEGPRGGHAAAVLAATIFHFGTFTVPEAKRYLASAGTLVRPIEEPSKAT